MPTADDKKRNQLLIKGKDFFVHVMRSGVQLHPVPFSDKTEVTGHPHAQATLPPAKERPLPTKLEAEWVVEPAWTF